MIKLLASGQLIQGLTKNIRREDEASKNST